MNVHEAVDHKLKTAVTKYTKYRNEIWSFYAGAFLVLMVFKMSPLAFPSQTSLGRYYSPSSSDIQVQIPKGRTSCLGFHRPNPTILVESSVSHNFLISVLDSKVDNGVSTVIARDGRWDVHVLKALEAMAFRTNACQNGEIAMDVGANVGFFTLALLAMGCEVVAFEMQEDLYEMVKFSSCINGFSHLLTIHNVAVSDKGGEVLRYNQVRHGNVGGTGLASESGSVEVRSVRIDSLILNKTVAVMKIDVEGYEEQAFSGMSSMFEKRLVKSIIMEFTPLVQGTERAAAMLSTLHQYGFQKVTEIDYMSNSDYTNEKWPKRPVDTSIPDWAKVFAEKIAGGGDSRGVQFTDLLLELV